MARESFSDNEVANRLKSDFICIKVDREERPDVDAVYMRACQAMTGGGGWPTTIFMAPDQTPFYAGTYFPKKSFLRLLDVIAQSWRRDKDGLKERGKQLSNAMNQTFELSARKGDAPDAPIDKATELYKKSFDPEYGGFGRAPKFPSPQNLMFLLHTAPPLAEKTLVQMYRGGIFDHIGGGFSRYSTDRYWLVPHFEKMLYDNALLCLSYLMAYESTNNERYKYITERTFQYMERDLADKGGGFFSAQDADSDGVEGQFYIFAPEELIELLGETEGQKFCKKYDITKEGNFEGASIPNLLKSQSMEGETSDTLQKVYDYRKQRTDLHTDTKKLTSWNALAAAAYAAAARILKSGEYQKKAEEVIEFIERDLVEGDTVFVGLSDGHRFSAGFLDDYAFYVFALIQMHQATLEDKYLNRAVKFARRACELFFDDEFGGFFFWGEGNEKLLARTKEVWDGAMPSGNSMMAYNLSRLCLFSEDEYFLDVLDLHRQFMNAESSSYPMGFGFYLYSVLPVKKIICVLKDKADLAEIKIRSDWAFALTDSPEYPMLNDKTTYYVCEGNTCLPPVNSL